MKLVSLLVLSSIFSQSVFADETYLCQDEAEQAVHEYTTARTQQAQFLDLTKDGHQEFEVRTNLHGGDAAYKITVDASCNTVSIEELWAE